MSHGCSTTLKPIHRWAEWGIKTKDLRRGKFGVAWEPSRNADPTEVLFQDIRIKMGQKAIGRAQRKLLLWRWTHPRSMRAKIQRRWKLGFLLMNPWPLRYLRMYVRVNALPSEKKNFSEPSWYIRISNSYRIISKISHQMWPFFKNSAWFAFFAYW